VIKTENAIGVRFELTSPDRDEGYPGQVNVVAEYMLDDLNQITMSFSATTDKPTHVNICNHAYWNMAGAGSGSIVDHEAKFAFEEVLEFDDTNIPTGKTLPTTDDDIFGFAEFRKISAGMAAMPAGKNGYDHCFVVKRNASNAMALAGACSSILPIISTANLVQVASKSTGPTVSKPKVILIRQTIRNSQRLC